MKIQFQVFEFEKHDFFEQKLRAYLRCIVDSTPSCVLLIAFTLLLVAPQLKPLKSLHGSSFQLERARMLIVACLNLN